MKTVIMLCGIPASGKTTHAQEFLKESYTELFSPDNWLDKTSNGEYNWTPERSGQAWANEYQRFAKWLQTPTGRVGCPDIYAIWDATFINPMARSPILHFSKGSGCVVIAKFFNIPPNTCIKRNNSRPESRRVPDNTMSRMIKNFEPPSLQEGFDDVLIIS